MRSHALLTRTNRFAEIGKLFGKNGLPGRMWSLLTTSSAAAARDLEKELGFKGKIERDGGWIDYVVAPSQSGPFPHGFSTMHHDWDDTYGRVLHCTKPEVYASLADSNYHYSE